MWYGESTGLEGLLACRVDCYELGLHGAALGLDLGMGMGMGMCLRCTYIFYGYGVGAWAGPTFLMRTHFHEMDGFHT